MEQSDSMLEMEIRRADVVSVVYRYKMNVIYLARKVQWQWSRYELGFRIFLCYLYHYS